MGRWGRGDGKGVVSVSVKRPTELEHVAKPKPAFRLAVPSRSIFYQACSCAALFAAGLVPVDRG